MRSLSNFGLQELAVILQSSFQQTELVQSIHVRYNVVYYKTEYYTEIFRKHPKHTYTDTSKKSLFTNKTPRVAAGTRLQ